MAKKVVLRTQKRRGELGRVAKLLLHVFLRSLSRGRLGIHREKAFLYIFLVPQLFALCSFFSYFNSFFFEGVNMLKTFFYFSRVLFLTWRTLAQNGHFFAC